MIEVVVEILGEFVLQVLGEALVELGRHALAEPFHRPPNPWLAAIGYALFGTVFGGLSLWVFQNNLVPEPWRLLNLAVTPLAVGGLMVAMGAWRARRGQVVLRIDKFAYGYLFALTLALVRFFFTSSSQAG